MTPAQFRYGGRRVDDAGAVEAGDDGQPPGDGAGGLEPANVLHPAQAELEIVAMAGQWRQPTLLISPEEHPQIRPVYSRKAPR